MHSSNLCLCIMKFNVAHTFLNTRIPPHLEIVLFNGIKTWSRYRRDKLCVVKKRVDQDHLFYEDLETKSSAAFMKKFNYENKLMFGNLINSVHRTCVKLGLKNVEKKSRKFHSKIKRTSSDLTYIEAGIPIENVESYSTLSSSGTSNGDIAIESANRVLNTILKFPLMDKIAKDEKTEEVTNKLNCLRQWLEKANGDSMPSVTSILEKTMPAEQALQLKRWKLSMIKELGQEGFQKYQQEMLFHGSSFHQSINGHLCRIPEMKAEVLPANAGHWKSLSSVLPWVKEVKLLEERVMHPFLNYKGVVDCLGTYKKHFVVVDWKTSKKPKLSLSSTYDSPLQVAAYVGALNFDPRLKYMVNQGLIVIAYENGTPATVHFIREEILQNYWQKWLQRLKTYYEKLNTNS